MIEGYVKVGTITKTHSLNGNVIITTNTNLLVRYSKEPVFIYLDGGLVPFFISQDGISVRNHKSYIVKFKYIDSIDKADKLTGSDVFLESSLFQDEKLSPEDLDIYDMIGFNVYDEISDKDGTIIEVNDCSGNVILSIEIDNDKVLLPFNGNFVKKIDFSKKSLIVSIPSDLFDLNKNI